MEQRVKVHKTHPDGTATVIIVRESACSGDCHECAGCGAASQTLLVRAQNPVGARVGQLAVMRSDSAPVLRGAAVLYLLPLALFFLGYWVGSLWGLGALGGGMAFALSIAAVVLYDRRVAKRADVRYTLVRLASQG